MIQINRLRTVLSLVVLLTVIAFLFWFFPRAFYFVEIAALELRYLWWIVLLFVLSLWFIFGISRKPK